MPTVRRYGNRQLGLTAVPGVRRTAALTETAAGVGLAEAEGQRATTLGHLGASVARMGVEEAARLHREERERQDEVKRLAMDNAFDQFEREALYDPQTGALTVRGNDALAVPGTVDEAFRQRAGEIEQTATNPRQHLLFEQVRVRRQQGIRAIVDRHVHQETQRYEIAEVEATEANALNNIAANALDERRAKEEFARGVIAIRVHGPRLGLGPEQLQQRLETFQSAAYSAVIDRLLSNGLDQQAKQWLDEGKAKDRIGGVVLAKLEHEVDVATTAGDGLRAASDIWTTLAPPAVDDETPIPLDQMEEAARARAGSDAKAYDATMKYLKERTATVEAARKDRREQTTSSLWKAVAAGASLAEVQQSPEYRRASGQVQTQVTNHIVTEAEQRANRVYTQGQRALAAVSRQDAQKEREHWAEYWNYSDPRTLSQMTEAQILNLTPTLGQDHVNRLMDARRRLDSPHTVQAATIDSDQFNTLAESAGLEPFKTKKSTDERAALGRLRGTVEAAIDAEQRRKNGTLSREEKGAIMTGILDQFVMLDVWGTDPRVAAATVVHATDQANAYVRFDDISAAQREEMVNVIRSNVEEMRDVPSSEIEDRWKDRMQRAEAARRLGLDEAEQQRRLLVGR